MPAIPPPPRRKSDAPSISVEPATRPQFSTTERETDRSSEEVAQAQQLLQLCHELDADGRQLVLDITHSVLRYQTRARARRRSTKPER